MVRHLKIYLGTTTSLKLIRKSPNSCAFTTLRMQKAQKRMRKCLTLLLLAGTRGYEFGKMIGLVKMKILKRVEIYPTEI